VLEHEHAHTFQALLADLAVDPLSGVGALCLDGPRRLSASPYRGVEAMALAMLAAGATAATLGHYRGLPAQSLTLATEDARRAIHAESAFGPTLNGRPLASRLVRDNPFLDQAYRSRDGQWIMPSALYPGGQLAWLRFLNVAPTQIAVAKCIASYHGQALEDAAAEAGLPIALCRTSQAWRAHPQGLFLRKEPVVAWAASSGSFSLPASTPSRPLQGLRVLALTQAVAGPLAARTLAEQGADVVHVGHPEGFEHEAIWCENAVGCRSIGLNFSQPHHIALAHTLLGDAHVVLVNQRQAALARWGMDAANLKRQHPHLICVQLSAYGDDGPWASRPGFDMTVMAATGMMEAEGRARGPNSPPCLPDTLLLNDYIMGYLAAAATTAAVLRSLRDGGIWHPSLNLARLAMWCQDLGPAPLDPMVPREDWRPARTLTASTPLGILHRLAPGVRFSHTPGAWAEPLLIPRVSTPLTMTWH
jgi:hypothetical protein